MMKGRLFNKSLISFIAVLTFFSTLIPSYAGAAVPSDLQISVVPNANIDIVLSLGKTSQDFTNFETDIKNELRNKGVNTSRVKVQAVETQELNVQDSFNWEYHGHDISDGWAPKNGKRISVTNNGRDLYFDGYRTYGYVDFMYLKNYSSGKKTFTFQMDEGLIDYHAMEGAGFLFNTDITGNSIKGYAIIIGPEIRLYQIDTSLSTFKNTSTNGINGSSKGTLIKTFNRLNTLNHDIKIEVDSDSISMWDNGQQLINDYQLPVDYGVYGFGPIASHDSHACSVRSNFQFQNLKMEMTTVKKFTEVIRMPEWRDGSKRFLVNADETIVSDFNDSSALGEILPRLSNENIHFIAYGNNTNKSQLDKVITMNNNNGAYYPISNYNQAVKNTAQYIVDLLNSENTDSRYVLVGEPVDISVIPPELMKNTQTSQYPLGRWKIDHNFEYFDNNMGQASWANQFQKDLLMVFDKPGRYEVFFEDKNPEPRYIYAHRRPIANYSLNVSKVGNNFSVSVVNYSYDPDREYTSSDKGIKQTEWKWREVASTTWNNGIVPSSLPLGKDYIVQLRVKDEFGVWSIPEQRYITTSSVEAKPIANFNISPNPVSKYETLNYENTSYDPAGRDITEMQWTVKKNGTVIHQGPTPKTSFLSNGEGYYTVSLKVKNNVNLWSEEFTRPLQVTKDVDAPEAVINPTTKEWTNSPYNVNITFTDKGMSGFDKQRFALTGSYNFPSSGFSGWDSSMSRNVSINSDGVYYLHIEAYDKEGNRMTRTSGPYKLDKTAPNAPTINLSDTNWAPSGVKFSITDNGDTANGSGIDRIEYKIEGRDTNWVRYTGGQITIPSNLKGKVNIYARSIDNVQNVSSTATAQAKIDDVPPVINGIKVETKDDKAVLSVDAYDNESGLNSKPYQYYSKIIGKDNNFIKTPGNWVSDNPLVLPTSPSNAKFIYKVDVRDNNNNISTSNEVVYVSSPIIEFSGIKEGDFANTVTINLKDNISTGGEVKVEVKRGEAVVAILESGKEFKDQNLDYERTYEYALTAFTTVNGNRLDSLPVKTSVKIGSPTIEMSTNSSVFYRTPFSKEVNIDGIIRFRQGGQVNFDLFKGNSKLNNKKINVAPFVTVNWNIVGNLEGNGPEKYKVNAELVGKENLYNESTEVTVQKKDVEREKVNPNKFGIYN